MVNISSMISEVDRTIRDGAWVSSPGATGILGVTYHNMHAYLRGLGCSMGLNLNARITFRADSDLPRNARCQLTS